MKKITIYGVSLVILSVITMSSLTCTAQDRSDEISSQSSKTIRMSKVNPVCGSSSESIVWRGIKTLTWVLAAQSMMTNVSADYNYTTFQATEGIGQHIANHFATKKGYFPDVIREFEQPYKVDDQYTLQFNKKKGIYVLLDKEIKLYGRNPIFEYTPENIVRDMECCELDECGGTSNKYIKFLEPETDPAYLVPVPTIEVNAEFTPYKRNKGGMCSLAKKVRFFFKLITGNQENPNPSKP